MESNDQTDEHAFLRLALGTTPLFENALRVLSDCAERLLAPAPTADERFRLLLDSVAPRLTELAAAISLLPEHDNDAKIIVGLSKELSRQSADQHVVPYPLRDAVRRLRNMTTEEPFKSHASDELLDCLGEIESIIALIDIERCRIEIAEVKTMLRHRRTEHIESDLLDESPEQCQPETVIADVLGHLKPLCSQQGVRILVRNRLDGLVCLYPRRLLRALFVEVLHNAIVHRAQSARVIECGLELRGDNIVVHVTGESKKIHEQEIRYRFLQKNEYTGAAAQDTAGLGHGLYLAERITHRVNGHLSISCSEIENGTAEATEFVSTVAIQLPVSV